jgi:hypothetical protein
MLERRRRRKGREERGAERKREREKERKRRYPPRLDQPALPETRRIWWLEPR